MADMKIIPGIFPEAGDITAPVKKGKGDFADAMKNAIAEAGKIQNDAEKAIESFSKGEITDIHTVVLAMEKADMSLQLLLQVRNKLLSAYEEVVRMQI